MSFMIIVFCEDDLSHIELNHANALEFNDESDRWQDGS